LRFGKENTMNRKLRYLTCVLVGLIGLMGLVLMTGCREEEPAATESSAPQMAPATEEMGEAAGDMAEETSEMAEMMAEEAGDMAEGAMAQMVEAIEQKTCPIMDGNPINTDVFVEYQGKKVYFCCEACKAKFNADPEKFVADLPQFQD
jgi:YHS domain-containing protein